MPRPRSVARSDATTITNGELAQVFREIADMLEISGEVVYKSVAYRRVADAIERHPGDVAPLFLAGTPPRLPGAGPALGAKLEELSRTGRLEYHERLRKQVPPGLLEMLHVPGVGPRTVKLIHEQLGIASLAELKEAAAGGQLRQLRGLSARSEANVLEAVARLERRGDRLLLHDADALVAGICERLAGVTGVHRIQPAGSLRRRLPTIGDVDLLAAVDDPAPMIAAIGALPEVDRVLSAGTDKSSVVLRDGLRVDLMVCPPQSWGSHLVHFTGSKEHNVRLRGRALDRGFSLSEKGFKAIEGDRLLLAAEEEEVYARLELPWIPPELREDSGELEAATEGRLPSLVTVEDLRGDTHVHSNWTDGVDSMATMAAAARDRGLAWMVLTDHSPSLGITRGLSSERVEAQRGELERLNRELAPFRLLHGTEVEIRSDGRLDYPDAILAGFDVVVASIHTGGRQSREQLTRRALAAIEHPGVDILAHPTGRIVNRREPAPLDWRRVFEAAARCGTALEINGSPRLDLDDTLARAAASAGAMLTIASDAHRSEELGQLRYGCDMARRAGLRVDQVLTTRSVADLLAWLA